MSAAAEALVWRVLRDRLALAVDRKAGRVEARTLHLETGARGQPVAGDRHVRAREFRLGDVEDEAVEDPAAVRPAVRPVRRADVPLVADVPHVEPAVVREPRALDLGDAARARRAHRV